MDELLVIGDLVFSPEGIQKGEGDEMAWRIRRESIASVRVVPEREPTSLTQWFYAIAYLVIGALVSRHGSGTLEQVVGVLLLGLGVFVVWRLLRVVTILRVQANGTAGLISFGRRLGIEESTELCRRLRRWGFPL